MRTCGSPRAGGQAESSWQAARLSHRGQRTACRGQPTRQRVGLPWSHLRRRAHAGGNLLRRTAYKLTSAIGRRGRLDSATIASVKSGTDALCMRPSSGGSPPGRPTPGSGPFMADQLQAPRRSSTQRIPLDLGRLKAVLRTRASDATVVHARHVSSIWRVRGGQGTPRCRHREDMMEEVRHRDAPARFRARPGRAGVR